MRMCNCNAQIWDLNLPIQNGLALAILILCTFISWRWPPNGPNMKSCYLLIKVINIYADGKWQLPDNAIGIHRHRNKVHCPRIITPFPNPNANLAVWVPLKICVLCLSARVPPHKPSKVFPLNLAAVLIKLYTKFCKLGLLSVVIGAI